MTLLQKIQKLAWFNEVMKLREILKELNTNSGTLVTEVNTLEATSATLVTDVSTLKTTSATLVTDVNTLKSATGVSGTFSSPTSITIVNGRVTAITGGV